MDHSKLTIKVDQQLTFSVNTQIKEQLKWLIGIGQIQPGDMLPAASQLADMLGLNRNTVNWVYTQLRDEGIVTMQKGKGTQVAGGKATEQLRKERMPMQRLLDEAIRGAQEEELDLRQLFMAGLAYTLLDDEPVAAAHPVWFIECRGHDHHFYKEAIERATGREVRTVFLDELNDSPLPEQPFVAQAGDIVTTLNHDKEVKLLLAPLEHKIHVVGATVDPSALIDMARLERDTHVSFVCLGREGGEWMAARVHDAGIRDIRSVAFGLHDRKQLKEALSRSSRIYASSAVYPELKERAPGQVALYLMRLEQSSENLLKELAVKT